MQNKDYNEREIGALHCEATGIPIPDISWHFNSTKLNNTGKHLISKSRQLNRRSSTLIIVKLSPFDVGTYICEATNTVGRVASSGILTVNGMYVHTVCIDKFENHVAIVNMMVSVHIYYIYVAM